MPFHVQIRSSIQRAWAFNLEQEKLREDVLDPWRRRRVFDFGDKEWDPQASKLTILEGPELAPADLSFGQGWHYAERSASDVTARLLGDLPAGSGSGDVAVLAESETGRDAVAAVLAEIGAPAAEWTAARARILAAAAVVGEGADQRGGPVALLVAEGQEPSPSWLFEAGLALGALGGRAIVVLLGEGPPPPQLEGLALTRLDLQQPASRVALIARLRQAGCALP